MILLVGDYSSVHYELSKALKSKKNDVILISDGDAYKKTGADILVPRIRLANNSIIKKLQEIVNWLGLCGVINFLSLKRELKNIENIEVVQFINPVAISSFGAIGNWLLISYLSKKAKKVTLCALGDDYNWVKSCFLGKYKYSAMDRFNPRKIRSILGYLYSLKHVFSPLYFLLNKYCLSVVDSVIPGLYDYDIAYQDEVKKTHLIRLPIGSDKYIKPEKSKYPLRVFHAWQYGKELKKGNDILDKMVRRYIAENGSDKILYEVVGGVPYSEYIKKYRDADIILDQVFSYDCGVTGALAMAAGKVVFSGFEVGDGMLGINALPDEELLYKKFCELINSLETVDKIKLNAYEYALREYNSSVVADNYISIWKNAGDSTGTRDR